MRESSATTTRGGKGHHRHYFDREEPVEFSGDWRELVAKFIEDVKRLRREMYEG